MGCLKLSYQQKEDRPNFLAVWRKNAGKESCDNYYPFGLAFNSLARENAGLNKWKFQGQEHVYDLELGWDSFKWRNHQPDIGRFFSIDPLASKYVHNSPYAFSENQVVSHVELEGLEKVDFNVVLFEPHRGEKPFRLPGDANKPVTVFNQNFTDTNPNSFTSKKELSFTADFETGEVSNMSGKDPERNPLSVVFDRLTGGDPFKLDYEMKATGNLSMEISIGGAKFLISGQSDGKNLQLTTTISGVSNDDGAVVKASGNPQDVDVVVGTKQGGTTATSQQLENIPYKKDESGRTSIESDYAKENNKRFKQKNTRK